MELYWVKIRKKVSSEVTENLSQLLLSSLRQYICFLSLWMNCFYWHHLNFQLHPSNPPSSPRSPSIASPHSATFLVKTKIHPAQVERYVLVLRGLLRNGLGYQGRLIPFFYQLLLKALWVELPLCTLLHFQEEFLGMRADLGASPCLDDLFDFLPIFPVDPETWMW